MWNFEFMKFKWLSFPSKYKKSSSFYFNKFWKYELWSNGKFIYTN